MSMNSNDQRSVNPGFIREVINRGRLILRLMGDSRVSIFVKAIPLFSIVYLVVPDLVIGPLDDAAVIGIASVVFVELCPPAVVAEHMAALNGTPAAASSASGGEGDVVEGKFVDVSSRPVNAPPKEE